MATPDYIAALRSKIGHDLLLLPGLTMVVLDDAERVLLIRRKDAPDRWSSSSAECWSRASSQGPPLCERCGKRPAWSPRSTSWRRGLRR